VNIDRGYGAGNNMTKLAAGSLDVAVVDPNLLAKFNQEQPDNQLISFFYYLRRRAQRGDLSEVIRYPEAQGS
jgi:hypothetical protein